MLRQLLLVMASIAAVQAADSWWTQFRGPNASGVAAADASPPVEFGPNRHMLWKTSLPAGHSSPVVWGDRIFLNAFEPESKTLELICVSAKNGAILWRRSATPVAELEQTHVVSNPATATPLLVSTHVYSYFSSFGLMAFTHDGKSAWTLPLPKPKTHHGSGASPILVAGDRIILNHDAMQGGYLLAVDRRTGKELWKQDYPAQPGKVESYSTPTVFHDLLILHRAGTIEAYEITTGKQRWAMPAGTSGASTPIVSDSNIYVNTWNNLGEGDQRPALPDYAAMVKKYDKDRNGSVGEAEFPADVKFTARPEIDAVPNSQNFASFRQVDRNKDGIMQPEEWEAFRSRVSTMAQDHGLLSINPAGNTPTVNWRENTSIPEVPTPLLYKGRVFLIRNGGIASCLDAATGKVIYRGRVGAPGAYFASPIAAAGRVYFASSEGTVTVLNASSEQLEVLARNELGDGIVATPAIAGKTIYVRTLRALYAFTGL
jgi:outer membrane protein assembly factor BamB